MTLCPNIYDAKKLEAMKYDGNPRTLLRWKKYVIGHLNFNYYQLLSSTYIPPILNDDIKMQLGDDNKVWNSVELLEIDRYNKANIIEAKRCVEAIEFIKNKCEVNVSCKFSSLLELTETHTPRKALLAIIELIKNPETFSINENEVYSQIQSDLQNIPKMTQDNQVEIFIMNHLFLVEDCKLLGTKFEESTPMSVNRLISKISDRYCRAKDQITSTAGCTLEKAFSFLRQNVQNLSIGSGSNSNELQTGNTFNMPNQQSPNLLTNQIQGIVQQPQQQSIMVFRARDPLNPYPDSPKRGLAWQQGRRVGFDVSRTCNKCKGIRSFSCSTCSSQSSTSTAANDNNGKRNPNFNSPGGAKKFRNNSFNSKNAINVNGVNVDDGEDKDDHDNAEDDYEENYDCYMVFPEKK